MSLFCGVLCAKFAYGLGLYAEYPDPECLPVHLTRGCTETARRTQAEEQAAEVEERKHAAAVSQWPARPIDLLENSFWQFGYS